MSMPGWAWPDDGPYTDCEQCGGAQVRMEGEPPYLCDDCVADVETVRLLQSDLDQRRAEIQDELGWLRRWLRTRPYISRDHLNAINRRVDDLEEVITKRNLMAWMTAYGRCDMCGQHISRGSLCTDCAAELERR